MHQPRPLPRRLYGGMAKDLAAGSLGSWVYGTSPRVAVDVEVVGLILVAGGARGAHSQLLLFDLSKISHFLSHFLLPLITKTLEQPISQLSFFVNSPLILQPLPNFIFNQWLAPCFAFTYCLPWCRPSFAFHPRFISLPPEGWSPISWHDFLLPLTSASSVHGIPTFI